MISYPRLLIMLAISSTFGTAISNAGLTVYSADDLNINQTINGTTTAYASFPGGSPPGGNPNGGQWITSDSEGNLYALSYSGTIYKVFQNDLVPFSQASSDTHINATDTIVADSSGNLYINTGGGIYKISSSGQFSSSPFVSASSSGQMAFDSQGNLYAFVGNGVGLSYKIEKFSPTGQDLGTFTGLPYPGENTGLAIDKYGNAYTSYYENSNSFVGSAIREYSPTGADLGDFARASGNSFEGLAFDPSGNLDAVEGNYYGGHIEQFAPSGADLGSLGTVSAYTQSIAFGSPLAVPEPPSVILMFLGTLMGLGFWGRFVAGGSSGKSPRFPGHSTMGR